MNGYQRLMRIAMVSKRRSVRCLWSLIFLVCCSPIASADILSNIKTADPKLIGDFHSTLVQSALDEAKGRLAQGDLAGCKERIAKLSETYKDLPLTDLLIAGWLFELNQPIPANQLMQQIGFEHPARQDTCLQLARLAVTQGRLYEASLHAKMASEATPQPEWSDGYKSHMKSLLQEVGASIEERRGRWEEARTRYNELLQSNPKSVIALQGLARAAFYLKDYPEAESKFRALEQMQPGIAPQTELAMAALFEAAQLINEAEEWLKKGAENEQNDLIRREYARLLLRQNRAAEAKEILTKSKPSDALKTDFVFHIAQSEQMLGNFSDSLPILEKLWEQNGSNLLISNHYVWALLESDRAEDRVKGLELAERNAQRFAYSIEAIATLGWAYHKAGESSKGEETFNRPTANRNLSRDAAFFLFKIKQSLGKASDADSVRKGLESSKGEFYFVTRFNAPTNQP
jgi:tetratricopeptide (TPR) repeat protein